MTFAYPAVLTLLALPVLLMVWEWRRRGTVVAEHVVNAAGLWARELGAMAGVSLPLQWRPYQQYQQALSEPQQRFSAAPVAAE